MSRRPDAPSWGVVVVGGVAVLVVIGFVVAVAFGGGSRSTPGEKVLLVREEGGALAVLAGRCLDERVTAVALESQGEVVWSVAARKGSIDRRFEVGGEPPLGFETGTALAAAPDGRVRAVVTFERAGEDSTDARTVDTSDLPEGDEAIEESAPACGGGEGPGATALLFAVGAAFVVAGYVTMLLRLRRS